MDNVKQLAQERFPETLYPRDHRDDLIFGFEQGYAKAEQRLMLTWEDVQLLDFYAMECQVEESKGRKFNSSQEFFEEVLRRFKKAKEE